MITPGWCQTMARYNAWQNQWMFQAADWLSEEERLRDRGAFFGSIHGTLAHLMWGDHLWIARFDGGPGPNPPKADSSGAIDWSTLFDWPEMMAERPQLDARIAAWTWSIDQSDLEGAFTWTSSASPEPLTRPRALCVMQMFNHQTHHRGQVHAMLTAAGAKTGVTDLPFMPEDIPEWH
ncbi:DinB family protein [Fontisubflavum oceani]|uniref:DinB family protein n=1 Tax=Fontisubflavum oceani TaxID=2978973 RepID=UPI0025B5C945|nr:DinB family protein [Fontisubflavum oceani]WJY20982.1 DinB family protein [Fontisubflavum oceani]